MGLAAQKLAGPQRQQCSGVSAHLEQKLGRVSNATQKGRAFNSLPDWDDTRNKMGAAPTQHFNFLAHTYTTLQQPDDHRTRKTVTKRNIKPSWVTGWSNKNKQVYRTTKAVQRGNNKVNSRTKDPSMPGRVTTGSLLTPPLTLFSRTIQSKCLWKTSLTSLLQPSQTIR